MSRLAIIQPLPISAVASSRGSGADNLLTVDPKEVWADTAVKSAATLTFDLGAPQLIDTIFLGYIRSPDAASVWSITGGLAAADEFAIQPAVALRVPDVAGTAPDMSHALWMSDPITTRYLAIAVTQARGEPLSVGICIVGRAFSPELGQEWGAGRKPIDTGTATSLLSGGFAIVEGARKRQFNWTFGDLSADEADQLESIALALGTTKPGLVIEDPDRTPGLRSRIHYGVFQQWKQYERRNRQQTRWDVGVEEWV